jgi:hypothetical protein
MIFSFSDISATDLAFKGKTTKTVQKFNLIICCSPAERIADWHTEHYMN